MLFTTPVGAHGDPKSIFKRIDFFGGALATLSQIFKRFDFFGGAIATLSQFLRELTSLGAL